MNKRHMSHGERSGGEIRGREVSERGGGIKEGRCNREGIGGIYESRDGYTKGERAVREGKREGTRHNK